LPEILGMDVPRLNTFRSDLQDIVILSCLLMLYRQIAGPKSATNIKTMKENLWVLLNDSETSLAHVVAEMVRGAGTVRGVPVSVAEAKVMDGVVDKTLAPDSKVFGMVTGRVMDLLFGWMVTHTIRAMVIDKAKLAKYGLVELEGEVQDLAHRLGEFARYNRTVYFDLLSSFYEEV
ncbi:T-complex 11, partial [Chytriomyces sp. MP71]